MACVCLQLTGFTQFSRSVKIPIVHEKSGWAGRLRVVMEQSDDRDYLNAAYAPKVDIQRWAECLSSVCHA